MAPNKVSSCTNTNDSKVVLSDWHLLAPLCHTRQWLYRSSDVSLSNACTNASVLCDPSLPIGENCVSRTIILTILFVCRNQRSLLETALKMTWSVSPCSSSQLLSLSCGKVHSFIPTVPLSLGLLKAQRKWSWTVFELKIDPVYFSLCAEILMWFYFTR